MSEEHESYSKEELLRRVNDLDKSFDSDVNKAEDLQERFSEQEALFRNTAGNDDGNEDRQETFNEDGDDV